MVVAWLTIGLPGMPVPGNSVSLRWDDPASRAEAAKLLTNALGPTANAPQSPVGLGFILRRPEEIQALRIFLQCQTAPTEKDLRQFLPDNILTAQPDPARPVLKFEPDGDGLYRVTVPVLASAANYLAWSEQLEPQFALIRKALSRPYARMDGNYAEREKIPIPNFNTVRTFVQTLGARAQCHFLLGRPEEALRDLALLHDTCRPIMEENKPMTLVGAMINVAVRGLYANQIDDGLRMHAWREPQLAALEEQLKQINILPPVKQSFEMEGLLTCHALETFAPDRLVELLLNLDQPSGKHTSWETCKRYILIKLFPLGWVYQNMAAGAKMHPNVFASLDPSSETIFLDKLAAYQSQVDALNAHWSPYTFAALRLAPNFSRACQTTAMNQTKVGQTLVACALERYHLAHGEYPETLDALMPQFIDKIPHDVIGGQPPHYRRSADGTFMLYSIGWSGRDNGGLVRGNSSYPYTNGDWVWPF
jgi:hypothetical protein